MEALANRKLLDAKVWMEGEPEAQVPESELKPY